MDFVHDTLVDGRKFRTFNVVDTYTRECLVIEVDTSLTGKRVTQVLERLVAVYGAPASITVDNGPEFISRAMDEWAYLRGVELRFIQPGKPTQNGYVESFNGKFREECLSQSHFPTLARARAEIELWRVHYNTRRPHSALRYETPHAFASAARALMLAHAPLPAGGLSGKAHSEHFEAPALPSATQCVKINNEFGDNEAVT